jgi:hypothetical protein
MLEGPIVHLNSIYNSVSASKNTKRISITKTVWLMLRRKIINVYSEKRTEIANTLCGQNAELLGVKEGRT